MPQPIAVWNRARGVWEVPETENLICEHSELFSATWPTSGTTRNGWAYELPTSAPPMDASGSSLLLPTPEAWEGERGPSAELGGVRPSGAKRAISLTSAAHHMLLRTPTAQLAVNGGSQHPDKRKAGGHGPTLADEVEHLLDPSNTASMAVSATSEEWDVAPTAPSMLLPTPTASDAMGSRNSTHQRPPGSTAKIGDTLTDAVTVVVGARVRAPRPGATTNRPSGAGSSALDE